LNHKGLAKTILISCMLTTVSSLQANMLLLRNRKRDAIINDKKCCLSPNLVLVATQGRKHLKNLNPFRKMNGIARRGHTFL